MTTSSLCPVLPPHPPSSSSNRLLMANSGVATKEELREVESKDAVQGVGSVVVDERKVGAAEESAGVKEELEGMEKEREALRRRVEEMERLFARAEREKGGMERSLSAAVAEKEESDKDVRARMKIVKSLQKRCLEMEGALAASKTEMSRVEMERKRIEEEKIAVDGRLQDLLVKESELLVANLKREMNEVVRKKDEVEGLWREKEREMEEALASARAELGRLATEKRRAEEERRLGDKQLKDLMKENNFAVACLKKEIDEMTRKKDELAKTSNSRELEMGEALASAKAEMDRLAMEKSRVEEEKSRGEKKLRDFMQENNLVVANLKKEIDELAMKNDEVETTRKAKDLEMEEALATAKAELDFVKMEKRWVEEEKSVADECLKGFMLENNLVVANLKGELDEMTRKMDELEKTTKAKELEMEETLASAKAEIGRLEMEKGRVEEEKSLGEKKLKDFMQENNLVVANLRKEIDEMTIKKDELERRWKAKDLEMEKALASTKAELDFVKMEKRRVEEERSLSEKKVEDLVFENNLVVAKLKNELNEMAQKKDELEEIGKAKELLVSELKISCDNLSKEIQRLQGEMQKETNEIMERESFFNIQQEEMTKSMDGLYGKLKEAMEEKHNVETVKHNQELKIFELEGEAKQLKQTVSYSEKLGADRAEEILRLQAEKVALEERIFLQNEKEKCLILQLEGLQTDKDSLEKEIKHLKEILAALEKSGKDTANEILRLQDENGMLKKSILEQNQKEEHLELKIFGLQETYDTLKKEAEDHKLMESSLKRSEKHQGEEILKLQEERDAIHRRSYQQREEILRLMSQLTELRESKDLLAIEVEQLKHTLSSLNETAKVQGKEILRLQYEKDDIQKSFDEQLEKGKTLELKPPGLQEGKDSLENVDGQIRTMVDKRIAAEKEMDSMKHEIVSWMNLVSLNRKGIWAWVSCAIVVAAAVVYVVKNH